MQAVPPLATSLDPRFPLQTGTLTPTTGEMTMLMESQSIFAETRPFLVANGELQTTFHHPLLYHKNPQQSIIWPVKIPPVLQRVLRRPAPTAPLSTFGHFHLSLLIIQRSVASRHRRHSLQNQFLSLPRVMRQRNGFYFHFLSSHYIHFPIVHKYLRYTPLTN